MMNPNHIIMRYSAMTGIRDPKVDTWIQNQEMYNKHGMAHPSLKKKAQPERRSRSPMLPGPRKTDYIDLAIDRLRTGLDNRFQSELMERYLAWNHGDTPWGAMPSAERYWPEWVGFVLEGVNSTASQGTVANPDFFPDVDWSFVGEKVDQVHDEVLRLLRGGETLNENKRRGRGTFRGIHSCS